jgi:hypothetical protein
MTLRAIAGQRMVAVIDRRSATTTNWASVEACIGSTGRLDRGRFGVPGRT